jgi:HAD superfamily hydrolase (TIGR01450 family)
MSSDQTSSVPPDLSRIRHLVLDMDGTIYRGRHLFACTLPFLERLRRLSIGYTFLTNNTSLSKTDYVQKLRHLGIESDEQHLYTSADSTVAYLRLHLPFARRIAILGTPSLCRQFEASGFEVGWEAPQAVVIGFDTTLTYERLCRAAYWIKEGVPFLATHPDLICPTDEPTVLVDCGSLCACLSAATRRIPVFLGKPDPSILLSLCRQLDFTPQQIAMVGDRIYTDIAMGIRAGVTAILVLTGDASREDATKSGHCPDLIVEDIGELGEMLERAQ